ncbi:MAG TPA: dynamin family protein [Bryobacteraceae bacterium]|nr:dynamin family protein [Bryobacteraceae bacterium]
MLLTLAREHKDDERIHTAQRILADLAEDAFRLAVVGKYNRGKSSLMNAMLGHQWLPTGILPLTSVITTVRYGSTERVLIKTAGSTLPHEISLHEIAEFVTEQHNPGNTKRIELAEIQLPSDLLRYGFLFIDTPGLGSGISANTEATRRFLPEVDAAVVVLSFESPLDQSDIDLLLILRQLRRKLFIVLNKEDLVSTNERKTITSFVREKLKEELQEEPLLFPLSARDGLVARTAGDESALERSGIKGFEDELIHFLRTQKSELFLRRILERTHSLLEQERLESTVSNELDSQPRKAQELLSLEVQERTSLSRAAEVFSRIRQDLPALLVTLLRSDLRAWCDEQKSKIVRAIEDGDLPPPRAEIDEWIRPKLSTAMKKVRQSMDSELHELSEAFSQLRRRGQELLGRELSDSDKDGFDLPEKIKAEIGVPRLPPLQWKSPDWTKFVPTTWLRRKAASVLEQQISLSTNAYCDSIRGQLESACTRWLDGAQAEAEQRIRVYAGRLKSLGSRTDTSETTSILNELAARLNDITENSDELRNVQVGYLATATGLASGRCTVCKRVSEASLHFLSRFQYQLTKDPTLQEQIGKSGGLCPFHSWMYESIGSPQGIAQAYAVVLENLAERLENLISRGVEEKLSDELMRLLPGPETCRVCQIADKAEDGALRELVQAESAAGSVRNICFMHLVRLVRRLRDAGTTKNWIGMEAVQFRRLAEDMRRFALKHNALRHYLSTEGERDAYLYGLMQVVGARQLSFVRPIKDLL